MHFNCCKSHKIFYEIHINPKNTISKPSIYDLGFFQKFFTYLKFI